MKIKEVVKIIETIAPPFFKENYDNVGLLVGNEEMETGAILLTIDITEKVIDEAIAKKTPLIVSHHPIVFEGLKKITGKTYVERCLIKAIQNNIAIYASHTNLDAVQEGVNKKICDKLGLSNCRILEPRQGMLCKLVTFVPIDYLGKVRTAVFNSGAGHIGSYDACSFNSEGKGTFRAGDGTNPFVGEKGELHEENEVRFETVFKSYQEKEVVKALKEAHPYEEVAYDIYKLENIYHGAGMGMIGELEKPATEAEVLKKIKESFKAKCIRHTALLGKQVKTMAVCGGSGSFLLKKAIQAGADLFVSSDFKYHQFFDAEGKILIADIGHFESEQYTTEIFYDVLTKKLTNFAIHFSEVNTNPLNYY
jgi:dinuclear metal center YbgI/SA1388 family protein